MHDASISIVFQRHNYQLRTVMVDNQPWFVAHDFARLIGALRPYRMTRLVDPHQRRVVVLRHASGGSEEVLAISDGRCLSPAVSLQPPRASRHQPLAQRRGGTHPVRPAPR
ncbi:BRO-N domain-containing protein [Pseudomonas solani]|uniref:BRO-N domain-containing protein n=1 Tax=Pseudomonas solani TaxID=2731552 RepID=UPI003C2E24CD